MANTKKKTFKEFLSENQNFWEDVGLSLYEDSDLDFATYKYLKENYYTSAEVDEKISEVTNYVDTNIEEVNENITSTLNNYWSKSELLPSYEEYETNEKSYVYQTSLTTSQHTNYSTLTLTRYSHSFIEDTTSSANGSVSVAKLYIGGSYQQILNNTGAINLDLTYVLQSNLPSIYVNQISFEMTISNDEEVERGHINLTIIANKSFGERDFVNEIATRLNENGFNSTTNYYPLNQGSYMGSDTYYSCYSTDGSTITLRNHSSETWDVQGAELEYITSYKIQ